ncbi:DNA methyltransferase [Halorubrum hochsteinianum]
MYLVDLREQIRSSDSLDAALRSTDGVWEDIYEAMEPTETLWVIAPNDYRDGRMWPCALAFADYIRDGAAFDLKNTISVHSREATTDEPDLRPSYCDILFLVRDKRNYQFHKDRIRVSHVYEGNEWGDDRETGQSAYHDTEVRRYNPEGKDPGNVWLREDRTQTSDQSVDETGTLSLSEAVRRCVLAGSGDGETVNALWADDFEDAITAENRTMNDIEAGTL